MLIRRMIPSSARRRTFCVLFCSLLAMSLGCVTPHKRMSVLYPGHLTDAKDFDVDHLARYKDIACAYRVAVGTRVATDPPAGSQDAAPKTGSKGSGKYDPSASKIPLTCYLPKDAADKIAKSGQAKTLRNEIIDHLRKDIDGVYNEYLQVLYTGKGDESLTFDVMNIGLTTASTLTLVTRTKTILTALATGISGVGLSYDKNFFGQQTFSALAGAMQARRDIVRKSILQNEQRAVDVYSLDDALPDLVSYFYSGTLPGALQEIQEESAIKSANATGPGTTPKASAVAFKNFPKTASAGMPVQVEAEVTDPNGLLVNTAKNSIQLTSSGPSALVVSPNGGVSAVAGLASFAVTFASAGSYSLTAAADGLTPVTQSIQVTAAKAAGAANKLAFVQAQPVSFPCSPVTVTVEVLDANGVIVPDDQSAITLTSKPAAGKISPESTVTASKGVATFTVSFPSTGTYTLSASASTLTGAGELTVSIINPLSTISLPITTTGIH